MPSLANRFGCIRLRVAMLACAVLPGGDLIQCAVLVCDQNHFANAPFADVFLVACPIHADVLVKNLI